MKEFVLAVSLKIKADCVDKFMAECLKNGKAARGSGNFIPRGEAEPVGTSARGPGGGTAFKSLLGLRRS